MYIWKVLNGKTRKLYNGSVCVCVGGGGLRTTAPPWLCPWSLMFRSVTVGIVTDLTDKPAWSSSIQGGEDESVGPGPDYPGPGQVHRHPGRGEHSNPEQGNVTLLHRRLFMVYFPRWNKVNSGSRYSTNSTTNVCTSPCSMYTIICVVVLRYTVCL